MPLSESSSSSSDGASMSRSTSSTTEGSNDSEHSSSTTGSPHAESPAGPGSPPMMEFTIQDGASGVGTQRPNLDISILSLTRYTFADRRLAANGPEPLEPPIERALLGTPSADDGGAVAHRGEVLDNDLVMEFTEERDNRQLSRIARRLLLPDLYTEACYDLHQFLATHETLELESVERNVFKCLKICARLSKLPGYSIQLMWQIIQQAHSRAGEFSEERARTISTWYQKLTNRIRLMAVSPASDGSAPPRLPSVPPRQLVEMQARDRLLPLPDMSVVALNDSMFNRVAGVSGAAHYLSNPTSRSLLPGLAENGASGHSEPDVPLSESGGVTPNASPSVQSSPSSTASDTFVVGSGDEGTTGSAPPAAGSSSMSTQEAELAIIESQLQALENYPSHRLGPMMRAALNLLVEMRFRLQLGLPRNAIVATAATGDAAGESQQVSTQAQDGEPSLGSDRSSPSPERNEGSLGAEISPSSTLTDQQHADSGSGSGTNEDDRLIQYVLDQISTSRRQEREREMALATPAGGGMPYGGFATGGYPAAAQVNRLANSGGVSRVAHYQQNQESNRRRRRRSQQELGGSAVDEEDEGDLSGGGSQRRLPEELIPESDGSDSQEDSEEGNVEHGRRRRRRQQ
ncbi:hypothetical protein GQ54DRAFT_25985 [Martensiomyces pterosporus]|nr:hypothetical protein GQ54DRAFT_25985 [Martensiomyces pterosporus]